MTSCPCCSHQLLRHIRANQTFWFCRYCWQEMPAWKRERNDLSLKELGLRLTVAKETAVFAKL